MPSFAASAFTTRMNSGIEISVSPRALRCAFIAVRRNVSEATPGISIGYWKARNTPAWARSSGLISRRFLPSQVIEPPVTS